MHIVIHGFCLSCEILYSKTSEGLAVRPNIPLTCPLMSLSSYFIYVRLKTILIFSSVFTSVLILLLNKYYWKRQYRNLINEEFYLTNCAIYNYMQFRSTAHEPANETLSLVDIFLDYEKAMNALVDYHPPRGEVCSADNMWQ